MSTKAQRADSGRLLKLGKNDLASFLAVFKLCLRTLSRPPLAYSLVNFSYLLGGDIPLAAVFTESKSAAISSAVAALPVSRFVNVIPELLAASALASMIPTPIVTYPLESRYI